MKAITKGEWITINKTNGSKFRRKIQSVNVNTFEWNFGWALISQVERVEGKLVLNNY